ncbi:hypothetical protein RhiirA5_407583 [Rhizophagus irregularis]|uniref:Uncharacterized protein n=1 Tax=Rhizophagus irregularis TaxID=588596 RepID=A0A2I1ET92_9GLOM|nr:hypothetical protein RhiirA5_407583 [Rhizophagus irregularis]PKY25354.1 hypothetical protein RhiirB3_440260 [Rhizophagus irregularis]CAB4480091.1 unnamed protein product [Rhizophagus irregularis]CAB5103362.1 unnamed protein product [Rhizophagus irregularis]CAB5387506.1 unnamed protein product [Rhizophagus irregularis]
MLQQVHLLLGLCHYMEARLHVRGRLVSILQSIGAAGLGTLGTSISSSFGAAIGTLIGGPKACNIFKRNQIFGRFYFKENNYQN